LLFQKPRKANWTEQEKEVYALNFNFLSTKLDFVHKDIVTNSAYIMHRVEEIKRS
jgi:hypothetical protein